MDEHTSVASHKCLFILSAVEWDIAILYTLVLYTGRNALAQKKIQ